MTTSRTAVFTIISKNYLHYARTLMQSVRSVHPGWDRWVLLVDRIEGYFDPGQESFRVVEIDSVPMLDRQQMLFQYSIVELNTAAKPWFFAWLFGEQAYDRVVYLDPDITVYAPLDEVEERWRRGALAVLTPHLTGRIRDDKRPSERDILVAGTYNLGFIAMARRPDLHALIDYWCEKSRSEFAVDLAKGLFTDQKWIDLAPGLFSDVDVLRHEGYNVAYWNLPHRKVAREATGYAVNGRPLVFFHFSGLDPANPGTFSKHQDRYRLGDLGVVQDLVEAYSRRVIENGYEVCRHWPYAFGRLADGSRIPDEIRTLYRNADDLRHGAAADPFSIDLNQPWVPGGSDRPTVTLMMRALYEARPDVRKAYPDIIGADRLGFAIWFVRSGAVEHRVPRRYVDPVAAQLGRWKKWTAVARAASKHVVATATARLTERVRGPRRLALRPVAGAAATDAAPAVPLSRREAGTLIAGWSGFYDRDRDDRDRGVAWMAPRAGVRLTGLRRARRLTIAGEYLAEMQAQANGTPETLLRLDLDGVHLGDVALNRTGRFESALDLPPAGEDVGVLSLRCDHWFVPAHLCLNTDTRRLSVRIGRISLDDQAVLDFSRGDAPYRTRETVLDAGVTIIGHVTSPTGVGESARMCAGACAAVGLPYTLVEAEDALGGRALDDARHPVNIVHINADQMLGHPLADDELFRDRYNIGVWHWELPDLPDRWLASFQALDEIWAPSRFVMQAVAAKSPLPVVHMPHGLAFSVPASVQRAHMGLPERKFLFLMLYDMRSFQARKNPEGVIEAFARAFPDPGAVGLVIKVVHADASPAEFAQMRARLEAVPGAILIDRILSRDEVYALEGLCDAYVSLHRSEGFGLGLAECMYLGRPVIGTGWSGNLDFMTARNSCLVDCEVVSLTEDHGPYQKGQRWAEPDLDHAAWYMRRLVEDEPWRETVAAAGQHTILTDFSPRAAGLRYRRRLAVIGRLVGLDLGWAGEPSA